LTGRLKKNGGAAAEGLGRSRGGFGTKIHTAVNGLGLPVRFVLTPGQAADVTQVETLLDNITFEVVIGDKGFDSRPLVDFIEAWGGDPLRENCTEQRAYDRERYKDRNLVQRFWNKVKHYHALAESLPRITSTVPKSDTCQLRPESAPSADRGVEPPLTRPRCRVPWSGDA
jgi:transposase